MELALDAASGHTQLTQRASCWKALGLLCQEVLQMVPQQVTFDQNIECIAGTPECVPQDSHM